MYVSIYKVKVYKKKDQTLTLFFIHFFLFQIRLFSSTREPGLQCDRIVTYNDSKHVTIIYKEQIYSLTLFQEDQTMLSIPEIVMHLEWIKEDVKLNPLKKQLPICVLTTEERTTWAKARNELLSSKGNAVSLHSIESSLFCILLSDESPDTPSELLTLAAHAG